VEKWRATFRIGHYGCSCLSYLNGIVNLCVDDHSRVVLHDAGDNMPDYINANYIDVSHHVLYLLHISFAHFKLNNMKIIVILYNSVAVVRKLVTLGHNV